VTGSARSRRLVTAALRPALAAAIVPAVVWLAGLNGCGGAVPPDTGTLTDTDRAAIHALDTAFVQAWLRDDTLGVLELFSPDGVLLPPGSPPVTGTEAIRAFWWPADGSHTRITGFTREPDEVGGAHRLAFYRGRAVLSWEYTKDGRTSAQTSRSTDLILMAPDPSGRWRILRQMWNPRP
jgi:uncharacterized protein (TIGR02246 family)